MYLHLCVASVLVVTCNWDFIARMHYPPSQKSGVLIGHHICDLPLILQTTCWQFKFSGGQKLQYTSSTKYVNNSHIDLKDNTAPRTYLLVRLSKQYVLEVVH